MNLVTGQYVEVSTIGVFVLLSILVYIVIVQHDYHSADMKEFKNMLICNIVLIVVDVVTYLLRWKNDTVYIAINHVMCVIFFTLHTVFGYYWLMYSIRRLSPEKVLSLKTRIITKIPIVINFILVLASVKTGWIYTISKFNIYNRGDFVWVPTVFMILYWVASSIVIIKDTAQQDKARERVVYIIMLLEKMNTVIDEENKKEKEYKLSLSAGFKIYGKGEKLTIDDVISSADKEMYEIKKTRH